MTQYESLRPPFNQTTLSKSQAIALTSTNTENLLGFGSDSLGRNDDLVVTVHGDVFGFESKAVGIVSQRRGGIDLY